MKAVVFDPFAGASGDMIVGALLDLGADESLVRSAMESVGIGDVKVEINRALTHGIMATDVRVHSEDHGDRLYNNVIAAVENTGLDKSVIKDAIAIFDRIANAESRIHDKPLDELIFHEVGTADAIADVLGACTAFHDLNLNECEVFSTPVYVGGGSVSTAHGRLPVPAPATVEILKDSCLATRGGPVEKELLTPTGAAILSHFVQSSVDFFPQMNIERVGYGMGDYDLDDMPNVLRIVAGEVDPALMHDRIEVLETNVDDVTGEVLGYLIDELLEAGAKDVSIIPAMMKKGRSGHIIQVICKPEDTPALARKIMEETGSLGVRIMPTTHRLIALREIETVRVQIAGSEKEIGVKIATDTEGRLIDVSAEYEDARKVAKELGIPLREVVRMAENQARGKTR